jgi:hypothetical protein
MSRLFTHYTAKPAFKQVNESLNAGEYIIKKKLQYSYCAPNICHPNKNISTFNKYYGLRAANTLKFYQNKVFIDESQLYSGLYTKLDLSDLSGNTPVISSLTGTFPVTIDTSSTSPFLEYNIDPSGNLFGNTTCGIDNYLNYVVYDVSLNEV